MADKEYQIKIKIDSKQLKQDLQRNTQNVKKFTDSSTKGIKSMDIAYGAFLGNLASQAVSKAIGSLFNLGRQALAVAQDLEVLQTQFTVLTGDATVAKEVLDDLITFSAQTPFQLPGLASATKQLIQAKVAQEDLIPTLKQIGDIAAVTGVNIDQLAIPFARLRSRGTLTLEELQKFDDVGAGLIRTIAEMNGMTINELRKDISAGKVGFEELEKAIAQVTSEGGQFANGMSKQAETLAGKLSTLDDNWNLLIGNLASANSGVLKDTVDLFINMIQSIDQLNKANEAYANNTDIATMSLSELRKEAEILRSYQEAGGIFASEEQAERLRKVTQEINKQTGAVATLNDLLGNSGANQSTEIMSSIGASPELDDDPEIINEEVKSDRLRALQLQRLEELGEIEDAKIALIQEKINELAEIENRNREQELEFQELAAERDLLITQKKLDKEEQLKKKQDKLDKKRTKDKQDEERTREQNLKSSLGTISTLMQSSNKEMFAIGKAAAISQATIDGYAAVQKALASAPPPFNYALAAAVGLATAQNIANITSQQPPAFQNGGVLNSGGTSLTGDNNLARFNDREMFLNMRQQAVLFNAIDSGAVGGAGLQSELLAELVEIQRTKNTEFSINGQTLNDELKELDNRRLN